MKKVLSLLFIILIIASLVGCGQSTETKGEAEWSITIETGDKTVEFTSLDAEEVGIETIKATMKKKDGTVKEQEWTGVKLAGVLEHAGVESFNSVVVEATDGYSKEYDTSLVNSEGTFLGITIDGKELGEDGPVQLVANGKGTKWWIKNVDKIIVK